MVEQLQKNLERDFNIRTLNAWFVDSFGRAASKKLVAKRLESTQAAITAYILRAIPNLHLRQTLNHDALLIRDEDVREVLKLPPKTIISFEYLKQAAPFISERFKEGQPFSYLTEILTRERLAPQVPPNSVKSAQGR